MKRYWIIVDNRQLGPLSIDEIAASGYLRSNTPVWHEGLDGWVMAQDVAELAELLTPPTLPDMDKVDTESPAEPPTVVIEPAPQPVVATGWTQTVPRHIPKEPESYLLWAILSTILCCIPVGIVAIVMSSRVSARYVRGDYDGACRASRAAELWIMVTVVVGLISMPFQMLVAML